MANNKTKTMFLLAICFMALPFSFSQASTCGNNIIEMGEACDGTDLGGLTCLNMHGYKSGTLSCKSDCSGYNISQCVSGNTIQAQSCQQTEVQNAINQVESGDTVKVPAGECEWAGSVSIPSDKRIRLQGAGIDLTVINRISAGTAVSLGQSGSRVTGFTFNEGSVLTDGIGWRVDNIKIVNNSSFDAGVYVRGSNSAVYHPTGLVDNCQFMNARVLVAGSAAMLYEKDWQNRLWTLPSNLGRFNQVAYVEDCTFEANVHANAVDANYGGSYVFRFNNLSRIYIEAHSVQGDNRATRSWEIYNNKIDNPVSSIYFPYRIRGGTGVVFNDIISGTWTNYGIALDNVRSYSSVGSGGICDGSSLWDGNEDTTGYPCRDQIGRGPDNPQWDHNSPGEYTQPLMPAYSWENRRQSNNALVPFQVINSSGNHIKANRDFYNQTESFDGSSGVGVGSLASRPTNCAPNVAYWATDQGDWNKTSGGEQGVLYKCTSENTWEKYYEPYTYPHPLRIEDTTALQGDLNNDGTVNIFDYNIFLQNFGTADCGNVADLNSDCNVNIFDYNVLLENFGRTQ